MPRPPAPHGTINRWRSGCRCPECSAAHVVDSRATRREAALERLQPHRRVLLRRMAGGAAPVDAVRGTGLSFGMLYGVAAWDTAWRGEMDAALMTGRSPDIAHGTHRGYQLGCRCPECRAVHTGQ